MTMGQDLTLMRIVNVLFWVAVWFAMEVSFAALIYPERALEAAIIGVLNNPARALGSATVPALCCFGIDVAIRRWREKKSAERSEKDQHRDDWSDDEKEAFRNLMNKPGA
jgi:hypothetical protein